MPVLDGISATTSIREVLSGAQETTRIIGLSASGGVRIDECMQSGMDEVQVKPLKPQKVIELFKLSNITCQCPIILPRCTRWAY